MTRFGLNANLTRDTYWLIITLNHKSISQSMSEKSPENNQDDLISVRKMGHNDPIWMKFELDVSLTLVDHNPKFQFDISKHV